jgi:hypothetical protein
MTCDTCTPPPCCCPVSLCTWSQPGSGTRIRPARCGSTPIVLREQAAGVADVFARVVAAST